jgi:hypothetical protein
MTLPHTATRAPETHMLPVHGAENSSTVPPKIKATRQPTQQFHARNMSKETNTFLHNSPSSLLPQSQALTFSLSLLVVLGLELRTSHLLGRHATT